jgi:hypothetical protein
MLKVRHIGKFDIPCDGESVVLPARGSISFCLFSSSCRNTAPLLEVLEKELNQHE